VTENPKCHLCSKEPDFENRDFEFQFWTFRKENKSFFIGECCVDNFYVYYADNMDDLKEQLR